MKINRLKLRNKKSEMPNECEMRNIKCEMGNKKLEMRNENQVMKNAK